MVRNKVRQPIQVDDFWLIFRRWRVLPCVVDLCTERRKSRFNRVLTLHEYRPRISRQSHQTGYQILKQCQIATKDHLIG